ncbi:MAG: ABC transporter permease subunit [Chloroflexi bacterium]|nr:ABC transporter permease subunit [Chloroflexota bacterium]
MARFALRRALSAILVLLAITYLSYLAQDFAQRTRSNQPAPLAQVAGKALEDSIALWRAIPRGDLGTYTDRPGSWNPRSYPLSELLGPFVLRSLALLILAMALGGVVGGLLGLLAAASRRRSVSLGLVLLSIVGISTPSFFLGMLLQYLEIVLYKRTGTRLLPVGGFGWDNHLVLPVLVLAARPIAQVARLTYARFSAVLDEDYVRTAAAKGLAHADVWRRHVLPNGANGVLTAMGTSLRFSLSSLPVVETLFGWPGLGKAMLDMLRTFQQDGATVLVLTLGGFFVAVNVALDMLYRLIDPRLREAQGRLWSGMGWLEWSAQLLAGLWRALTLQAWRERRRAQKAHVAGTSVSSWRPTKSLYGPEIPWLRRLHWRRWAQATLGNPALLLGLLIGGMLAFLFVAGPSLARHNPYTIVTRVIVNGHEVLPPAPPSPIYPWGTDTHGRDILSLILAGTRRTLSIALLAVIVRLALGGVLGFLAGWFAGSRLDRAIMNLSETLAAFPTLLLAMLVVYAMGIQRGLSAFVVALAIVGWGEVMQTVRGHVMEIKPRAYIEGALAAGLTQGQILTAHVLPNVWPSMISLSFLEMGGVLMILGELGFLGVFIGGGLAASGDGLPTVIYYDIPEWSVMLAHSWRSFRSYPWITFFPAGAFFVAILGFTLLGEGIRWLSEHVTLSLHSLFNRYTLAFSALALLTITWALQSADLYASFAPLARGFQAARAMADIEHLAGEAYHGRLSGTAEADAVADWLAAEFEALGLQPAGETTESYFHTLVGYYRDLVGPPRLTLYGPQGEMILAEYGRDFVRRPGRYDIGGSGAGEVVLIVEGLRYFSSREMVASEFGLSLEESQRTDRIVLYIAQDDIGRAYHLGRSGTMSLHIGPLAGYRYELLAQSPQRIGESDPAVLVSRELVERLLEGSGHTLDELLARLPLKEGERSLYLPTGWRAELEVPTELREGVPVRNVLGRWPGSDVVLDDQAIVVAAYYDGLGRAPDGTLYPGANDNASGVATMLEMVRTLKEGGFQPKRTLLFVAWVGGERHRAVDYERLVSARPGFARNQQIVAAFELEGVGAGIGATPVAQHLSSERLTRVLLKAAAKMKVRLSTKDKGLHADEALWPAPHSSFPSAVLSWAGSDELAHRPEDTPANIDPDKLGQVGRTTSLALMVLANDPAY